MGYFKLCITGDLGFEFWKDIPEYEGLYQASTYGRIKNVNSGRILKPFYLNKSKYLLIDISKNKIGKTFLVHRLIAIVFLPKWKIEFTQINHKSEIVTENQVWNLEWCDAKYNNNFGTRIKRVSKPVKMFSLEGKYIDTISSTAEAERKFGINQGSISAVCNGKRNRAGKYKWEWAE